jgi:hypothetical protein
MKAYNYSNSCIKAVILKLCNRWDKWPDLSPKNECLLLLLLLLLPSPTVYTEEQGKHEACPVADLDISEKK